MHLYKPDNKLPGINLLLDTDELADRLRTWLGPVELSITNIRYKPATSCLISYKCKTASDVTWLHAKAFNSDDWTIRKRKLEAKQDSSTTWIDNEFSIGVFRFPFDSELAGLRELATDGRSFVSKVLFDEFEDQKLDSYKVLAYKPNRRFVAKLNFESAEPLVLKLHNKISFKDVVANASALKKLAITEVPRHLGRSARHRALAYRWLNGKAVDLATLSFADREKSLNKIFDYLENLHRPIDSRVAQLPVRASLNGVASVASYLSEICDPFNNLASSIQDQLCGSLPANIDPVLVHGDFYDRQLIEDENSVRACDFDECCIADRTTDLANLVAHLRYRACLDDSHIQAAEEVNEAILYHMSKTSDDKSLAMYEWSCSASLFRLATHPFRSGNGCWVEQTEGVLAKVVDCISDFRFRSGADGGEKRVPVSRVKADSAFAFLEKALDAPAAQKMFRKHLPKLKNRLGSFAIERILVHRHKPGRRMLIEYELATDKGLVSILGKASARKLDRRTVKAQRKLYRKHGFGPKVGDGLFVPQIVGTIEPWQMWFQEKLVGRTASELMSANHLAGATERIAAAISKLHQCGFKPSRSHTFNDELAILSGRLEKMMTLQPDASSAIEEVLENCIAVGKSIGEHSTVSIHRDFYQDQILFDNDSTFLLDLDLVALGHPALDVGNFLAHLTEHGLRVHDDVEFWANEEAAIMHHYLERNPTCAKLDVQRYKAIALARHISISWEIKERRFANQKILLHVQQQLGELIEPQLVTKP